MTTTNEITLADPVAESEMLTRWSLLSESHLQHRQT